MNLLLSTALYKTQRDTVIVWMLYKMQNAESESVINASREKKNRTEC